jgi:hypothetical protein
MKKNGPHWEMTFKAGTTVAKRPSENGRRNPLGYKKS